MSGQQTLWGRGAVVVGATSGIGHAVAHALARHGAGVVVNGRNESAVERTVNSLTLAGQRAVGLAGSAADETVATALVDTCVRTFGTIDILVNCAGIAEPAESSILDVTTRDWRALLDSHLTTTFNTCRAAAPKMVAQRRGSIINTSSFAYLGDYGGTGYAAGKGAVNSLTLAIAAELAEHEVRANVVCPGAKTRLSSGFAYEAKIMELYRRGMLDEMSKDAALDAPPAEYVAPLYLYLAGSEAREVTGQIFVAAGGFVGRYDRPTPSILGFRDHTDTPPWTPAELHRMITGSKEPAGPV
ncbi:SDR family NAD(P)-dependent oxidoreductase [Nocardia carnea]|uniref:SDR family NAD(P)-dependent oxidoreductase n=1 Tax=Nocardia carnea TaxID=37328 RepID=UPI0024584274|nr:SDR family oxidoreductase [Nocardia carnea]